jgi:general secretion pathway protein F
MMKKPQTAIRLRINQQYEFFKSLEAMLSAGLQIQAALEIQLELQTAPVMQRLSRELHAEVSRGSSLSQAIEKSNFTFSASVQGSIRAGEEIGKLDSILSELCDYLKLRKTIREKLLTASLYPALVLMILMAGLIAFAAFFAPQFIDLIAPIDDAGAVKLARSLDLTFTVGVILIFAMAGIAIIQGAYSRRSSAKELPPFLAFWERCLLALPIIRTVIIEQNLLQLYFTLRILMENGISLEKAIAVSLPTLSLHSMRIQMRKTVTLLQKGVNLSSALKEAAPMLPPRVHSWIGISERTGDPVAVFSYLYDYQKSFVANYFDRLMSLIEPALTLITGIILLAIVIQFMAPFLSIYTSVA